jgi:U2 small nuclear ribonucleoprotein A'
MRLTPELLRTAPAHVNPLKDREIVLRGYKIPVIENLGVTQDHFDTLDLSDNEIVTLDNFPLLNTLRTLILNNNRISSIADNLGQFLPRITALMLTNNQLVTLESLAPLAGMPSITNLSLVGNAVCRQENYRLFCIHLFPHLKILDFNKVKPVERKASATLYGKPGVRKAAAVVAADEKKAAVASTISKVASEEQKNKIRERIQAATSLEEINRLERMLETGEIDV